MTALLLAVLIAGGMALLVLSAHLGQSMRCDRLQASGSQVLMDRCGCER